MLDPQLAELEAHYRQIDEQDAAEAAYDAELQRDVEDDDRAADDERRKKATDAGYHVLNENGAVQPTKGQRRRANKMRRLNRKIRNRYAKSRRCTRNGDTDDQ